ncbi:unnamed protein product [Peniophora sp. CBMAI 1063]|nr:unnamed protein product [Peniophora sp. CBMAI 1063]
MVAELSDSSTRIGGGHEGMRESRENIVITRGCRTDIDAPICRLTLSPRGSLPRKSPARSRTLPTTAAFSPSLSLPGYSLSVTRPLQPIAEESVPPEAHINSHAAFDRVPPYASRTQALVIGINEYAHRRWALDGAVGDADDICDYLYRYLGVPDSQVVNLRDKAATHEAIVAEIKALSARPGLREGDPIFIYFAGHGCVATAAGTDGGLPMIWPHDVKCCKGGAVRQAISYNLLDELLRSLVQSNGIGANITIVFDCCLVHRTSGKRSGSYECWKAAGYRPYAMLLACSEGQEALETVTGEHLEGEISGAKPNRRGVFTGALLRALKSPPNGIGSVTYRDLLKLLDLGERYREKQTPSIKGLNVDRPLFCPCTNRSRPAPVPASPSKRRPSRQSSL